MQVASDGSWQDRMGAHLEAKGARLLLAVHLDGLADELKIGYDALQAMMGRLEEAGSAPPEAYSLLGADGTTDERDEVVERLATHLRNIVVTMLLDHDPDDLQGLAGRAVDLLGNPRLDVRHMVRLLEGHRGAAPLYAIRQGVLAHAEGMCERELVEHTDLTAWQAKELKSTLGGDAWWAELRREMAWDAVEEGWSRAELLERHNAAMPERLRCYDPTTARRWRQRARKDGAERIEGAA